MNNVRRHFVELYPEFYELTEDEVTRGWHFCPTFGHKLIGPEDEEIIFCLCDDDLIQEGEA